MFSHVEPSQLQAEHVLTPRRKKSTVTVRPGTEVKGLLADDKCDTRMIDRQFAARIT